MWGVVPAAGMGSRIQPLAFSKELLPVGAQRIDGHERPRAVAEYLLERMVLSGADRICVVIGPGKTDLITHFGSSFRGARLAYVVQQHPAGLCDALFHAASLVGADDPVLVGLPDTIWFPVDGFRRLRPTGLSFLLFPVDDASAFDAVACDETGRVKAIEVKKPRPSTSWIWGAFRLMGRDLRELEQLWRRRDRVDEYFGTLVNAWLAEGGEASAVKAGEHYVDVGTLGGYRAAITLLAAREGGDRTPHEARPETAVTP